jgi:hypothetical protein
MKIRAIGQWSSSMQGSVEDGQILEVDPFLAEQYIQRGYAMAYETKVEPIRPKSIGENATSSPAAPVAQAKKKQGKQKATESL